MHPVRTAHLTRVGPQNGYILLPVVLFITLISVVAFLLNHESALGTGMTGSLNEAQRADSVAQAGLQHAIWGVQNSGCAGDLTLASIPLGADSYQATVTSAASTTTYTINVDQDAWLKASSPGENHGSDSELSAKAAAGDDMRALYRFDLSAIPAGAQAGSATAWFYVTANDDNGAVNIHEITAAWTEAAATWTTTADQFNSEVIASIPTQVSSGVWVQVNLTTLVQGWINGSANNGIMLVATSDAVESKYTSREWSPGSERPWLEVVATSGPASPVTVSATGTLANGVTRTLNRVGVPAYQPPSSLAWQPGAELEDAFVWDGAHKFKNFGVSPILNIKNDRNVLLRFALEALPPGARVIDARLGLYLQGGTGVVDGVLDLHRVSRSWVEGIYDDVDPATGQGVTYQEYDGGNAWTTPGGDYDATVIDSVTLPSMVPGWYEWNVTAQIQAWLDGVPNDGFLLREGGGDAGNIDFTSSDNTSNPENRPRLILTFACECGIACQMPQGSGNILMVVSNEWFMTDGEKAKKSLFESWGYTVDLISQWDVDWNFDAKAANNDVVYVSEAVASTTFGMAPKLAATALGVINEEGTLNDELGIASGLAWPVGNSISITDTSHYITQPFAAGSLPIFSAPMEGLTVSGSEAGGLQTLADWGTAGSLVVLDAGAVLEGGGNAPGRRVMLPLGRDQNFNPSYLNNNGRLIVQRALQWGTGNTGPLVSDPIILSTDSAATLGGLAFDDIDLAEYDTPADSASLFFDGTPTTLTIDIDALHILANGHILLSTKDAATLGGLSFADGDLVDYDAATDTAVLYFEETAFGADEDIISVYLMDNGHILLSTDSDAALGGLSFTDNDLVEYNAGSDTATLYFDGSTTTLNSDIDAVHLLDNGHILLSTKDDATLGGLSFSDGDLVEYDPATDTTVRYFDEARFAGDEDVISAHIGLGSGGGSTPGPPAGDKLLLVVVNPSSLTAQEGAKKALIASWGYTVSLIDESDSQASFDASVAANDVVYITEDVSSSAVGTKLVNAPIGVVTEEDNLSDEFGFSDGIDWGSDVEIQVNDNSHYITQPFAIGNLTIFTATESLAYLTGSVAPDLQVLGRIPAGTSLVSVEAGADVINGRTAAGRRVLLPWGGNNFDVNHLNDDGKTTMKRAIEWGAGAVISPTPIAHWKLDETSGTMAVDSEGGHDGTLAGNPTWSTGTLGGALDFDGAGDRVNVGPVLDGGAAQISVTAWVFKRDTGDDRVISKSSGTAIPDHIFSLGVASTTIRARLRTTDNGGTSDYDGGPISLNQWVHVAFTYDGGTLRIYKDGTETASYVVTGDMIASIQGVAIGNVNAIDDRYWNGLLDDVRIYDRALDPVEIADLAVQGGGGGGCDGTFRDDFNVQQYDQNDGSLIWATNWEETGETTSPTGGDISIDNDASNYQLQVRDDGQTVMREADLSGAAGATLSFDYRRQNLSGSGDYVAVEVSYNAGTNWTELERFTGTATDAAYTSTSHVLDAGSLSATTRIRFLTPNNGMGNNNMVWFDNIQIQCSP